MKFPLICVWICPTVDSRAEAAGFRAPKTKARAGGPFHGAGQGARR